MLSFYRIELGPWCSGDISAMDESRVKGDQIPEELVRRGCMFEDAKKHLRDGNFWLSYFDSHQAAEFYLKALMVAVMGFHPYTRTSQSS